MKESLIHIRFDMEEMMGSKKEILSAQKNLIEILQRIKKYHILRIRELKFKSVLYGKLKEMKLKIKKLEQNLPKIEFQKSPEKKEYLDEIAIETSPKSKKDNLSIQLEEIQKKLRELEK